MTDESGGDQLGTLEVGVVGSLAPLEAALQRAEQMLQDFDKKFGTTVAKAGKTAGANAKARRTDPGTAADAAPAAASAGANRSAARDAKITAKVAAEGARDAVAGELKGEFPIKIVTEELKLKIDQVYLKGQVLAALRGIEIPINVSGVHAAPGGFSGAPSSANPEQIRHAFPPELTKALNQIGGLGDSIGDLYNVVNESLTAAGQRPVGTLSDDGDANEKMAQIADRFGITGKRIVEYLDKEGKPTANVTGGPLAPAALASHGIDPEDAKVIADQARVVSELSKGSAYLTHFFEALPNVQRMAPQEPTPAPTPQPVQPRDEAVLRRTEIPTPAEEPVSAQVKRYTKTELQDYVSGITGPGKGALPAARDVLVPARLAEPGETPLESLQAAKTGAGRRQAIQGGLGPLTSLLQFAERGGFENFAEVQKNGRGSGQFIHYDPETKQGGIIRREGYGVIGDEVVKRANPISLLETALKHAFPGIDVRSDPSKAMTSLLERVLVGPGRQAVDAGKRLAIPGRGFNPDMEAPNQTGKPPAGGPFTGGLKTSTGSLRQGYQDLDAAIEADPRIKRARRAQQLAVTTLEARMGEVGAARRTGSDPADSLGRARDALIAKSQIDSWVMEARTRVSKEMQGLRQADAPLTAKENRERIRGASEGRRVGEEMVSTHDREIKGGALEDYGQAQGLMGRYTGILEKVATSNGVGPNGVPESLRSVQTKSGAFTQNMVRRLLEEEDNKVYDALGLEGRKRKPSALPDYVQAERNAVRQQIYGTNAEAEKSLNARGEGSGGWRAKTLGGTLTGVSTPGGAAEFRKEPLRPTTSLDVERQTMQMRLEAEARKVAERRVATIEADRAASGANKELFTPVGVEDVMFAPPTRGARGSGTKSGRRIKSDIMAEVESTTDVGKRSAQIRDIRKAADNFLRSISMVGTHLEDVVEKDVDGNQVTNKRRVGQPDVEQQRHLAQNRPLINLPAGVSESDVRKEVMEVLESRAASAARAPKVTQDRSPLTGDQGRRVFRAGGGVTPPGEEMPASAGGGFNGGGVGIGGGGRSFVPGGAPIEVIVVGKFPLPVEITGGVAGGSGGEGGSGKPRKNVGRRSAGGAWDIAWKPDEMGPREPEGFRYGAGRRKTRGEVQREAQERMYADLFKQADARDRAAAVGRRPVQMDNSLVSRERQRQREQKRQFTIAPINRSEVALERQRERMEREAAKGIGGTNLNELASAQDAEQQFLRPFRGLLRTTERRIPKRGFTASLTDLITARLGGGGFASQLEDLGQAQNEFGELNRLTGHRASLRTQRATLTNQLATVAPGTAAERKLNERVAKIDQTLGQLDPAINRSAKRLTEFAESAGSTSKTLRSFAAAGAGAAVSAGVGSLTFGLGLAVTGPLIAAVAEGLTSAVGPTLERLGGFAGTQNRVIGGAADQALSQGAPASRITAQREALLGLSSATAERFAPVINERTQTETGNKQLQGRIDELNTYLKTRRDNINRPGDIGLTQTVGGFFGAGGTAPTSELISTQFDLLPTRKQRNDITGQIGDAAGLLRQQDPKGGAARATADYIDERLKVLADADENLRFFNDALKKGGETALKFTSDFSKVSPDDIKKQERAFRSIGAQGLADKVRDQRVALTDNGRVVTDPSRLIAALQAVNNPKLDPGELLNANKDQIRANFEGRFARLNFATQTLLPTQTGIEGTENPLAPPGAGINTTGLTKSQISSVNSELKQSGVLFSQYNAEVKKGRDQAVDFVRNGADLFGTGQKTGGLGSAAGAQFETALNKSAAIGGEIQSTQIDIITKQAAYAAQQYAYQIGIAKRSLSDAKALTGQITGDTKNLGAIERQQFELGRESQQLQLELSQRQINFQRAVANFQAPGLSSEEREARKQAAKIEAEYAQKQLNIQKQLFGLQGKGFEISASRSVSDLVGQLNLLEKGRVLTIDTAIAEKKILFLTKLQALENKKVEAYYSAAVENTNDIISLTQDLAAQTGKSMADLANDVLKAYIKVITGIENNLYGGQVGTGTQSGGNSKQKNTPYATGGLFNTSGATDITVGEAGGETVAVLRNPKPFLGGGGGGGQPITILVTGNTVRNDDDLDEIARKVERVLNSRGAQLGLRPFGG